MENNDSLGGLIEPFRSGDVDGIEVAIRRRDAGFEIVVACRSKKKQTFEHEGTSNSVDCSEILRWMVDEAIARALGTYKELRQSDASPNTSVEEANKLPLDIKKPRAVKQPSADVQKLTERQREVLCLIAEGNTNKMIALKLGISAYTVNAHRVGIMDKLDLHDVRSLTRFAAQHGLIDVHLSR